MGTYSSNYPVRYIGKAAIHGLGDFNDQHTTCRSRYNQKWKTPKIISHIRINYHVAEKDMWRVSTMVDVHLNVRITVLEALENSYLDAVTNASGKLCYCRHEPEIRSILKDLVNSCYDS